MYEGLGGSQQATRGGIPLDQAAEGEHVVRDCGVLSVYVAGSHGSMSLPLHAGEHAYVQGERYLPEPGQHGRYSEP